MRKRFNTNPKKHFPPSQKHCFVPNPDETSDMMRVKKVKRKEVETETETEYYQHPRLPSHGVDGNMRRQSVVTEPSQSASDAKTSEFAFFKKLKQDVGCSKAPRVVEKDSNHMMESRPTNNVGEMRNSGDKDVKSLLHGVKFAPGKVDGFCSPRKNAPLQSSAMASKADQLNSKSPFVMRTPRTIDLDCFLSTTGTECAKAGLNGQGKDVDIFVAKRLKLQRQIMKTWFPEADKLPKECDLVSLLLQRLLPESSEKELERSQAETTDKYQLRPFPVSDIRLDEKCDSLWRCAKPKQGYKWDADISATNPTKFRERFPSYQTFSYLEPSGVKCPARLLLGYKERDEHECSLNSSSSNFSSRFTDGNGSICTTEDYDYSIECQSNRIEGRNLFPWSMEDRDYSMRCNSSSYISKHELGDCISDDHIRDQVHSSWVPSRSFVSFAANGSVGNLLEYKREALCLDIMAQVSSDGLCSSACPGQPQRRGSSGLCDLRPYAEHNHQNEFEMKTTSFPLLLSWDSDKMDTRDLSRTSNMELDIYHPASTHVEDDQCGLADNTTVVSLPSFSRNSFLQLPLYTYDDNLLQRHHSEDDQNYFISRSRFAPLPLSGGSENLNLNDSSLFSSMFREHYSVIIPGNNHHSTEDGFCERDSPTLETLLNTESSSDLELKCKPRTSLSELERQYGIPTDNLISLREMEFTSSQFLFQNDGL